LDLSGVALVLSNIGIVLSNVAVGLTLQGTFVPFSTLLSNVLQAPFSRP
jgi:hypothetical protein